MRARALNHRFAFGREAHAPRGAIDQHHMRARFDLRQSFADAALVMLSSRAAALMLPAPASATKEAKFSGLDAGGGVEFSGIHEWLNFPADKPTLQFVRGYLSTFG